MPKTPWTTGSTFTLTLFDESTEREERFRQFFLLGVEENSLRVVSNMTLDSPAQAKMAAYELFKVFYKMCQGVAQWEKDFPTLTLLNALADRVKSYK